MNIQVKKHTWGTDTDTEIKKLLYEVFVGENYTAKETADKILTPEQLRKRGIALTAADSTNFSIAGIVFYVPGCTIASQIASSEEAEIHLLAVNSLYRRLGVGRALVEHCFKLAYTDGRRKMVLSTQSMMTGAHRLYELMGFTRNESRDWLRPGGGKHIVYEKSLKGQ